MRDSFLVAEHAARCQREAEEATLDNVRERALRSKTAWTAMAARSALTEGLRDAREARSLETISPVFDSSIKS